MPSIVEGHGEEVAAPRLLARLAEPYRPADAYVRIPPAQRLQRDRMFKPEYLESYLNVAAADIPDAGAIFLFLDADDDAACLIGPRLLTIASTLRSDREIVVCVAEKEFEAIFIAAATSLNFTSDAAFSVRDAKGEIERRLGAYSPRVDQARLVSEMDMNQAMVVPHLQRLDRKVRAIVY